MKSLFLKKKNGVGGLLVSTETGDETLEYIYHHIFTSDTYAIDLIKELDDVNNLKWYKPKNGLYINKKIYPFTTPVDLVKFNVIPFFERIKTGLSVLKAKKISDYLPMEKETAKDWLIKNSGEKAYEKLWNPLLRSKFGEDADRVSAVWIWNKFKLRGNSRDNIASESLGYLNGGFGQLIFKLEKKINEMGGKIYTSHKAIKIKANGEKRNIEVETEAGIKEFESDIVVAAVGTPVFKDLTQDIDGYTEYKEKLEQINYKANICVIFKIKKPLSEYYWTTVCEESPFVLVIEQNNLMNDKNYDGHVVYLSRYLDEADKLWKSSDEEIYASFTKGLKELYPEFNEEEISEKHILKSEYTQPVVEKEYSKLELEIKTPIENVYLSGMSQIYPEDRGINYAIRLVYETKDVIKKAEEE